MLKKGEMMRRSVSIFLAILLILGGLILVGCDLFGDNGGDSGSHRKVNFTTGSGPLLSIVSGSENKELEPILSKYTAKNKVKIEVTYLGSLDIMNMLRTGSVPYDALWPASSMWLTMGDKKRILKHTSSISNTPIVFGITESKARELNLNRDDVKLRDIIDVIERGKLSFAMTSATQSNSGASSYLAFLTALAGEGEVLQDADLDDPQLVEEIKTLLAGVNRSSGSSNWLVDLFLEGNYDAMVNYEALVISANEKLRAAGRETLVAIYPKDAISLADSPLAFVSGSGREDKEKLFLDLQNYLLEESTQREIVATGRRDAYGRIYADQKEVFTRWGIDTERILAPITMPRAETVERALNLYQTSFKKPGYTVYVLDYSGSMIGAGRTQMLNGLAELLLENRARQHLLQGTPKDRSYFISFNSGIIDTFAAMGNSSELENAYNRLRKIDAGGGTDMYIALSAALDIFEKDRNELSKYQPAIVVLTDGVSATSWKQEFFDAYEATGLDIPIFSITYGSADASQLEDLAQLSRARVFDGRKDLTAAFKSVKGYN